MRKPNRVTETGPARWRQPHISLSDRNERVIDAQTGLLLKRLSAASDTFVPIDGAPFTVARGSDWQNLSNLAASDGNVATISASTAPLFLGIKTNTAGQAPYTEYINSFEAAYVGRPKGAWGYYQAHIVASVNHGGTAPVNPDNAKIVACLTVDGINCFDDSNNFEAALTTNSCGYLFRNQDHWRSLAETRPYQPQLDPRRNPNRMAQCAMELQLVNMVTGDFYGTSWVAGSAIQINGSRLHRVIRGQHHQDRPYNRIAPLPSLVPELSMPITEFFEHPPICSLPRTMDNSCMCGRRRRAAAISRAQIDQVVDARTVITHDFPPCRGIQTQFGYPVGHAASNFGVLVRKKTTSADTISIDYGYVNYEIDFFGSFTVGGVKLCSDFTVAGPNGNQGYNCQLPNVQSLLDRCGNRRGSFLGKSQHCAESRLRL